MAIALEGNGGGKYSVGKKKATLPKSMTKVGSGKSNGKKITTKKAPKKSSVKNHKENTSAKQTIKNKKEPVADNTRGVGNKVPTPVSLKKAPAPKKKVTTVKKTTAPKKSSSTSNKKTTTTVKKTSTPTKKTTTVTKKPVTKAPVTKAPAPKPTPKPVPKPTPKPPVATPKPPTTTPPAGTNYDQQIKDLMDKINFMQQNMLPSQNINAYDKAKYLFTPSGGDQNVIHEYQGAPGQVGGQPYNPAIPDAYKMMQDRLRHQITNAKGGNADYNAQLAQMKRTHALRTMQRYMNGGMDVAPPQNMQDQMKQFEGQYGRALPPGGMRKPKFPGNGMFQPQPIGRPTFPTFPNQPRPLPVQPQPVKPEQPITTLPYQPL